MSDTVTTEEDIVIDAGARPTIELLGQADAGGCCGGGACGI